MKFAFIIVTFNTPSVDINRIKGQIKGLKLQNSMTIVIDNTYKKRGYAAGVNDGLRIAEKNKADIFVILNPDISFVNITKKNLTELSERFDVGGFAMRQGGIIYYRGMFDKKRLSTILETKKPRSQFVEAEYVTGSYMVIKKNVFEKIGLFDTSYGMYYEDADFSMRARKAGFKIGIDSHHSYLHFETSKTNKEKEHFLSKNRLKFFLKYASGSQKLYELMRIPKTLTEKRGRYFFNFVSLNFSSFANKLLQFGLFIVLISTFQPADYGIYTLVWAQVNILSPLLDLGTTSYGLVYLQSKKTKGFPTLFSFRFFLACIIFFLTLVLSSFAHINSGLLNLIFFSSFIFFSNAFSGSYLILNSVKQKLYRSSIVSFIFGLVFFLLCSGVVLMTKSLYFLFFTSYILYVGYALVQIFLLKKEVNFQSLNIKELIPEWKEIVTKSFIFVLISFFAGIYYRADVFILAKLKGAAEVGIYSTGYKFFDAFMFIAASYNVTATPVFGKLIEQGKKEILLRMKTDSRYLLLLSAFVVAFCVFILPLILPYMFKPAYVAAIPVIRIVILGLPFVLLTSIFFNALYVLKKPATVVFIFVIQSIINVILNIIFIPKYSYIGSSWITVLSEVVNTTLAFFFCWYYLRRFKK